MVAGDLFIDAAVTPAARLEAAGDEADRDTLGQAGRMLA
jgi:hypothetical protein